MLAYALVMEVRTLSLYNSVVPDAERPHFPALFTKIFLTAIQSRSKMDQRDGKISGQCRGQREKIIFYCITWPKCLKK